MTTFISRIKSRTTRGCAHVAFKKYMKNNMLQLMLYNMDVEEIGCKGVDLTQLAQSWIKWLTFV
jgi:hypothetical protein